jgi:hypothetical protein
LIVSTTISHFAHQKDDRRLGACVVQTLKTRLRPFDILTKNAFENAVTVISALRRAAVRFYGAHLSFFAEIEKVHRQRREVFLPLAEAEISAGNLASLFVRQLNSFVHGIQSRWTRDLDRFNALSFYDDSSKVKRQ